MKKNIDKHVLIFFSTISNCLFINNVSEPDRQSKQKFFYWLMKVQLTPQLFKSLEFSCSFAENSKWVEKWRAPKVASSSIRRILLERRLASVSLERFVTFLNETSANFFYFQNKKQRLIVRTAVLKGKDPYQIIADLERLDKMEYDFTQSSALNEKVLKDKRRKLKETWDRLCRLYVSCWKDFHILFLNVFAHFI